MMATLYDDTYHGPRWECAHCGAPLVHPRPNRPLTFCSPQCRNAARARPVEERFWEHIDPNGPIPEYVSELGPCWIWTSYTGGDGYGQIGAGKKTLYAHDVAYEVQVGPIPPGHVPDHLCRRHNCVNGAHLEAVTPRENTLRGESTAALRARQTHCIRGHLFDEANTIHRRKNGRRDCRTCQRERDRKRGSR